MKAVLNAIRAANITEESEALEVLKALMCKFKPDTMAGDAILDAIIALEESIGNNVDYPEGYKDESWKARQDKACAERGCND